jgi:hypothetical protein
MKKPTIIALILIGGYCLLGCSVGYFTHKMEKIKEEKVIKKTAKEILNTPDIAQ